MCTLLLANWSLREWMGISNIGPLKCSNMNRYSMLKRKLLNIKYWIAGYSKTEQCIRRTLSNYETDALKEVGLLISAAFMCPKLLSRALEIALARLDAYDSILFPKHIQYYKSLLFIQKVCMVSTSAEKEVKKHYIKILAFAFYDKECNNLDTSIRISSTSILKQINKSDMPSLQSHTTFMTCLSHRDMNSMESQG
ncbi:hypothetical protein NEAUS06_1089 [Nematocida ausubeli]|nr:hypothetical protein NEAUS06_1089 [Nematocida ausubeli]